MNGSEQFQTSSSGGTLFGQGLVARDDIQLRLEHPSNGVCDLSRMPEFMFMKPPERMALAPAKA